MKEIKNVIVCGIGAVGSIYAEKIEKYPNANLKVLVDKQRLERYTKNPIIMNGQELHFDYILPETSDFKADLIIIATKFDGLNDAIRNLKNFVQDETIILSLLNGVTSEEIIAEVYGWDKLLLSYFMCPSAVRNGRSIVQDGKGKIVFGAKNSENRHKQDLVRDFFDKVNIYYEVPEDMEYALWLKYMLNVSTNQPTAVLNLKFGEMHNNDKFMEYNYGLMKEVQAIAKAKGIKNTETMIPKAQLALKTMNAEGMTSMLQDVLAKRKTEVEMFAGTMIKLGKKYNISVPYNKLMKEKIELIEAEY